MSRPLVYKTGPFLFFKRNQKEKFMKLFIFIILFSTKLFASELSIEVMKNIKCYYYNDPNQNPVMMLYFTGSPSEIELIVNLAESNDDEAEITTLYHQAVEVLEMENKIVVRGQGLQLDMKTPIAFWNHGEARDSKLMIKSQGINTHLVCEQQ